MAESNFQQMSVQHIKRREQQDSPCPVHLVHHQQPQSRSPGAQHQLAADLEAQHLDSEQYHRQQALVAIQDLERQRLMALGQQR